MYFWMKSFYSAIKHFFKFCKFRNFGTFIPKFFYFSKSSTRADNIYFEETKESKIERINQLKFDYFIDDLMEILKAIDNSSKKILYNPHQSLVQDKEIINMTHWNIFETILTNSSSYI